MDQSSFTRRATAVLAVMFMLGMAGSQGLAATKTEKAKKTVTTQPGKSAKFIPGSQESAKERSTRLKRECKGRVNAGACEGYTQ